MFILLLLLLLVAASPGDRSTAFQTCIDTCDANRCHLPLVLRLTRWTCTDDCKYACTHLLTDQAIALGRPVLQYYGKWPFWRLWGAQEPASVVFSLCNLWVHLDGARRVRRHVPPGHPFRAYYLVWAYVSVNAWTWSTVFHTRDLPLTEKWDYFSAALAILYALYFTVIRMAHLYSPTRTRLRHAWSALCILAYLAHVTYLSLLPRFDYAYNMAFNLVLGIAHNLLWLLFALRYPSIRRFPFAPKTYRPKHVYKAAIFVALTTAATALELFDFPPLGRVLDAHALWHLSTAPIAMFWYDFLIQDAQDPGWHPTPKAPRD